MRVLLHTTCGHTPIPMWITVDNYESGLGYPH